MSRSEAPRYDSAAFAAILDAPGVEVFPAGVAEAARSAGAEEWTAGQRERARRGRTFAAMTLFVAHATA